MTQLRGVRIVSGLLVLGSAWACGASPAAESRPFGIDDYIAMRSAQAVAVSPDGKGILYDVRSREDKGPQKHEWHMIDSDGGNPRRLELSDKFEPLGFTKDGALYGTYKVDDSNQLADRVVEIGLPERIRAVVRRLAHHP